jgi:hypothetical protein
MTKQELNTRINATVTKDFYDAWLDEKAHMKFFIPGNANKKLREIVSKVDDYQILEGDHYLEGHEEIANQISDLVDGVIAEVADKIPPTYAPTFEAANYEFWHRCQFIYKFVYNELTKGTLANEVTNMIRGKEGYTKFVNDLKGAGLQKAKIGRIYNDPAAFTVTLVVIMMIRDAINENREAEFVAEEIPEVEVLTGTVEPTTPEDTTSEEDVSVNGHVAKGTAKPGETKTEEPKSEPKTEEPKAEAPKAEVATIGFSEQIGIKMANHIIEIFGEELGAGILDIVFKNMTGAASPEEIKKQGSEFYNKNWDKIQSCIYNNPSKMREYARGILPAYIKDEYCMIPLKLELIAIALESFIEDEDTLAIAIAGSAIDIFEDELGLSSDKFTEENLYKVIEDGKWFEFAMELEHFFMNDVFDTLKDTKNWGTKSMGNAMYFQAFMTYVQFGNPKGIKELYDKFSAEEAA